MPTLRDVRTENQKCTEPSVQIFSPNKYPPSISSASRIHLPGHDPDYDPGRGTSPGTGPPRRSQSRRHPPAQHDRAARRARHGRGRVRGRPHRGGVAVLVRNGGECGFGGGGGGWRFGVVGRVLARGGKVEVSVSGLESVAVGCGEEGRGGCGLCGG